jgi:hypothetical protein
MGFLHAVIKAGGVGGEIFAGAGGQRAGRGQHCEIAVDWAACAADVSHSKPVDLLVAVKVPGIVIGVRTPLHHAEGQRRSWECVAAARGANERIDRVVCAGSGLSKGGNTSEQREQNQAKAKWSRKSHEMSFR